MSLGFMARRFHDRDTKILDQFNTIDDIAEVGSHDIVGINAQFIMSQSHPCM